MKTTNKLLIYDDLCPFCAWYTGLFVKYRLLPAKNRIAFSHVDDELLSRIDFAKAKDEIPLVDLTSNRVDYGIDALLSILEQPFPFVGKIGRLAPIYWFLKKLYRFISFNRKVVVAQKCGKGDIDCSPAFNIRYRLLLVAFAFALAMGVLPIVRDTLLHPILENSVTTGGLLLAALLLATVNYSLAAFLPFRKAMEYLGQHSMLSILLVLCLLPLILAANYIVIPLEWQFIYILLVALLSVREYIRRMKYLGKFAGQYWIRFINSSTSLLFALYSFNLIR